MGETTKTYFFCIECNGDADCMGMILDEGLSISVDFTEKEVVTIRQLVSNAGAGVDSDLMPILASDAPDLYQRIDKAARRVMFDHFLVQAAQEYEIEFDDEERQENFHKDIENGLFVPEDFIEESNNYSEVPEDDEELFDLWSEWEHNKFEEEDAAWIRSRYTIDESWIDVSEEEYICYMPEEFVA